MLVVGQSRVTLPECSKALVLTCLPDHPRALCRNAARFSGFLPPPILQYSAACCVLTDPCALRRGCVNFICRSNASSLRSGHFAPTTDSCRALLYSNLGDRCRWSAFCVCLICGGTHLAALMMHFDLCAQIRAGCKVSVHIAAGAYR